MILLRSGDWSGRRAYVSFTATTKPDGPQEKHNYSAVGIGVAIASAVAIGAGVYLWLRSSKTRSC